MVSNVKQQVTFDTPQSKRPYLRIPAGNQRKTLAHRTHIGMSSHHGKLDGHRFA